MTDARSALLISPDKKGTAKTAKPFFAFYILRILSSVAASQASIITACPAILE